jgi:methylenetetrahydrofolate--tRNA-(uracil-5-)-methyltransferase
MKPVGLPVPQWGGRRAWAVVQLRREDRAGQMWNLVGFQTRLKIPEQKRIFRMIPGLENAEFLRWGSIHRNTYLNFPARLSPHGSLRDRPELLFAGQVTGVEGYTESTAVGILAAANLDRIVRGLDPAIPPPTTMMGGLMRYLRESDPKHFAPMNSNFGLLDPLDRPGKMKKEEKRALLVERARADFAAWMDAHDLRVGEPAQRG